MSQKGQLAGGGGQSSADSQLQGGRQPRDGSGQFGGGLKCCMDSPEPSDGSVLLGSMNRCSTNYDTDVVRFLVLVGGQDECVADGAFAGGVGGGVDDLAVDDHCC